MHLSIRWIIPSHSFLAGSKQQVVDLTEKNIACILKKVALYSCFIQLVNERVFMKITPLRCPHCGSPSLEISPSQEFCECPYCKTKYRIDRTGDEILLRDFLSLRKVVTNTQYLAAIERYKRIEDKIEQLELSKDHQEKHGQHLRYLLNKYNELYATRFKWCLSVIIGIAIVILWLLWRVIWIADGIMWYILLLACAVLFISEIYLINYLRNVRRDRNNLIKIRVAIESTTNKIKKINMELQDLNLERDFCQQTIDSYRFRS